MPTSSLVLRDAEFDFAVQFTDGGGQLIGRSGRDRNSGRPPPLVWPLQTDAGPAPDDKNALVFER